MPETIDMTIEALAVEICQQEPDIDAAISKLRRKLAPRKDEIIEEMYSRALRQAIWWARHHVMIGVKRSANPSRVSASTEAGEAAFARGFLSSWATPAGGWLKDATGQELADFASKERETARGHEAVARFYDALRAKVADNQTVGKVLTDEQAAKIWRRECGDAGEAAKTRISQSHRTAPAIAATT